METGGALRVVEVSRSQLASPPCPLCGRHTRAHSRIEVADIEGVGRAHATSFAAVICRDCAFALVLRSEAGARRFGMA